MQRKRNRGTRPMSMAAESWAESLRGRLLPLAEIEAACREHLQFRSRERPVSQYCMSMYIQAYAYSYPRI